MIHTLDHNPPHVTVYKGRPDNYEAKARINIETCKVIDSEGFSKKEENILELLAKQNKIDFMEAWYETRPK